ncbi:MAG: hypothetical protein OXC31_26565 [Spirochaetaceae bacterium]|nr:hypothetical protein [Spirochaetaceae bacterium]
MALEGYEAYITVGFRNLASGPMGEFRRDLDRMGDALGGGERAALRAGGAMEGMADMTGAASADVMGSARLAEGAFTRMGDASDLWADDYRRAAREIGLSSDMIDDDLRRMARETDRAGDQAGESTGLMQRAWRGLDIIDDIGGVIGMVDGLTAGLREMAREAIEASRTIETEFARLRSIDLDVSPEELAGLREWADSFSTQRGGVTDYGSEISPLVAITTPEMIALATASQSSGLDPLEAQASAELSAGISRLPGAGTPEESRSALMRMSLFADPDLSLTTQMEGWADMLAEAQRIGNIPAMSTLTGAIEASVKTATTLGMTPEEYLSVLTTFHRADEGDPVGEALNSINEELQGGMRDLGLQPSFRDDGGIDFMGSLLTLREYRERRSDLGAAEFVDHLGGTFGELGGREIAALLGPLWEEFTAGIPSLQAADERDMLVTRLEPLQDRALAQGQIGAKGEVAQAMRGDLLEAYDRDSLRRADALVEGQIERLQVISDSPARSIDPMTNLAFIFSSVIDQFRASWRGRSIGETLAEGVPEGGPALGAAVEGMLQRDVDPLMSHSDAERGPLSPPPEAGRPPPATMAAGVLQSQDLLGAALSGSLTLPELTELQAAFGDVESPLLPLLAPLALTAAFGDVAPPLTPDSPLTELQAAFGDVDAPLLPLLAPLALTAAFGDVAPPLAPDSPAQGLTALLLQALGGGAAAPGDPELLRALRDLVDELRAARTATPATRGGRAPLAGAAGAVTIERLDLHVRDDLLQTLGDLHYLLERR